MGITYGDYLIDSGHYDITPEQEREIEARVWMVVDQERQQRRDHPIHVQRCADCPARYANGGCSDCDGF